MDITYDTINSLDEIAFIAGTDYTFTFNVNDVNGNPLDITSGTAKWTLSPYGQTDYAAITKDGTISGITSNQFSVVLLSSDTKDLYGKYIQQPIIIDFYGEEFRPAQGVITIIPRVQNN